MIPLSSGKPSPAYKVYQARKRYSIGALVFALLLSLQHLPSAQAQENHDTEKLHRHLLLIVKKSFLIQQEISALMAKPATTERTKKIEALETQLNSLNLDFESMATRLQLEDPALKKQKKMDWLKEVEDLTVPLLQAVRDMTEKPRRIDQLKKTIEDLENKLLLHEQAYQSLNVINKEFPEADKDDEASQKLEAKLKLLRDKYDPELVKFNLEQAQKNLEETLASGESLVDSASKRIKTFFKTRGRNLLVTFTAVFGLWWVLTRIRKWVVGKQFLSALSPRLGKLFIAAYNIFVLIISLLTGLACLYFFNDWLLISLAAMIFILGVWTSRQWIPKFFKEIKLIVNLGTVREGERLIWQGLPWLVREIGLEATLVNENLDGGEIKLHLGELIGKHSRPVVDHEPWFPTRTHDWVILPGNIYGKVEQQTLEQVVLKLKGGALKYYSATEFVAQNPLNISSGFRYSIEFGLDYGVQSRVCEEIPRLFEEGLRQSLQKRFEGESPDFNYLEVRFDHAGPSSLNLIIIVHCDGRCAGRYEENQREIQAALVQICNDHGLTIPFNRLTIDISGGNQGKLATGQR